MSPDEVLSRVRLHIGERRSLKQLAGASVADGSIGTDTFTIRYSTGKQSFRVKGRLRCGPGATLLLLRLREEPLSWRLLLLGAALGFGIVYFGYDRSSNLAWAFLLAVIGGVALPRLGVVPAHVVNAIASEFSELLGEAG